MIKLFPDVKAHFMKWIDAVAEAIVDAVDRYKPPRVIELVEADDGAFNIRVRGRQVDGHHAQSGQIAEAQLLAATSNDLAKVLAGSRVELSLQSRRFLFSPLELPGRASEFLGGIVRTQIDRLTPWSAADAAYGWGVPEKTGVDRIKVTVAATAHALLARYVEPLACAGSHSVAIFAQAPQGAGIKVVDQRSQGRADARAIPRLLIKILVIAAGIGAGAFTLAALVGASLDARQQELSRRIAQVRATAITARDQGLPINAGAMRLLEARKHNDPSSLIVLEVLSRILPDHTYVTELRIEGNKLRLVGITRDAPSLIGLIEQSARFSRATFFAPTTRLPSDQGERFHIEVQLQPLVSARS